MHVVVLGAGVIGVSSAWYLRQAGHQVTVIDRQPAVGLETSFANGAQISAGHAEPWAQPGAIAKILRWLPREDAPLLFRLRLDAAQWRWGLQFLGECRPQRFHDNLRQILALGRYSRDSLVALRTQIGLDYLQRSRGIMNLYEDAADFAHARQICSIVGNYGYDRHPISADEAIAREPVLAPRRPMLVGASWTPPDESGDAWQFCEVLAGRCRAAGVTFRLGQVVRGLQVARGALQGVQLEGQGVLPADACVVALGSYSAALLKPLGLRIPVYPAKGYSATVAGLDPAHAPEASITDETSKMVFTRIGDRLRIAGTAEFNGYGLSLNPVRCAALVTRGLTLFPRAADYRQAQFWTGLRPATPSNRPLIGATKIAGLYLNTGHGTLGWTEACGASRALSLLMDGKRPDVDFRFLEGH